eukprot:CAMPEP_0113250730 /NCGR_PEP_ID=MMETSP0008_2-20120614/11737_1 /TAXON_ID=97485 /ORGANISM="Prymnesium parvum" /LENGTH=93 /DNA_ID=CAMNT_0000098727 /DNA_START=77 /DNA_END=359 /DNA_ORIENTATION=- /assembly_acc=CAM_ASM_000153
MTNVFRPDGLDFHGKVAMAWCTTPDVVLSPEKSQVATRLQKGAHEVEEARLASGKTNQKKTSDARSDEVVKDNDDGRRSTAARASWVLSMWVK